jgi:hypothetical protein
MCLASNGVPLSADSAGRTIVLQMQKGVTEGTNFLSHLPSFSFALLLRLAIPVATPDTAAL